MPSDVKARGGQPDGGTGASPEQPLPEPPSARLIVQLFLVPLLIVAGAVGVMFLIGRLAGGTPSFEEALSRLRNPGGARTAQLLVGPGSKQRYMDAKTVADKLLKSGATLSERAKISDDLVNVLHKHTTDQEGDVRHFLLLALGRAWQVQPGEGVGAGGPEVAASRQRAMTTLLTYANGQNVSNQKAALLALAYWSGQPEAKQAIPVAVAKVRDESQDLDVRLAAATVLGPLASSDDAEAIEALKFATRDTNPANRELVWSAALSLAQHGEKDVADTLLMLLDRSELSTVEILDREGDPGNPKYQKLSDEEQQRILINTMIGAARLEVPAVQEKLRWLRDNDPSPRVRAAAAEVLAAER